MTAPANVDEQLVEKARELVRAHRQVPSRNQLKAGLRVGSDKAAVVRAVLVEEAARHRADLRRAMRKVAAKGSQARRQGVFPTGLRPGLPVPVSPMVGPAVPVPSPQVIVPAPPVEPTPVPAGVAGPERSVRKVVTWPALLVAAPAFVAIWAGWVAIGKLTGFGKVNLLPGFSSGLVVDTAITLPVGVEVYSAFAFYVFLHSSAPRRARVFAAWSAGLAVVLGMGAQTAYHLMSAGGMTAAPWQITTFVSCLPVAVFAVTAVLVHLVRAGEQS